MVAPGGMAQGLGQVPGHRPTHGSLGTGGDPSGRGRGRVGLSSGAGAPKWRWRTPGEGPRAAACQGDGGLAPGDRLAQGGARRPESRARSMQRCGVRREGQSLGPARSHPAAERIDPGPADKSESAGASGQRGESMMADHRSSGAGRASVLACGGQRCRCALEAAAGSGAAWGWSAFRGLIGVPLRQGSADPLALGLKTEPFQGFDPGQPSGFELRFGLA